MNTSIWSQKYFYFHFLSSGQRSMEAFRPKYVQPANLGATFTQSTTQSTPSTQRANQNTPNSQPANQNTPHVQVHFFHKSGQKARAEAFQRFLLSKLNMAKYTGKSSLRHYSRYGMKQRRHIAYLEHCIYSVSTLL